MALSVVELRQHVPSHKRLADMVWQAFGPLLQEWITKPGVEDIALNPDGKLWALGQGMGWQPIGEMSAVEATGLMHAVAGLRGEVMNHQSPILETELPEYNLRFEGFRPPIVSSPAFSIRKAAPVIYTLADYLNAQIITEAQSIALLAAIRNRDNILLAGGPGSGKTTLLNALLLAVSEEWPEDRIAVIQDTLEIQCSAPNLVELHAKAGLTMLDCLRASLRIRAGRLVVGEVRDQEAHTLLKAWNTGHTGGLATIHASSAEQALARLESLVGEASGNVRNAQQLIANAVQTIVFVSADPTHSARRRVRQVLAVQGLNGDTYRLAEVGM